MPRSMNLVKEICQMQPLIIIGMHRSGTSLIVRLLNDLGFFMGESLSRDAEAIYFQKINRRIYNSVGSKWSDIDALSKAMQTEYFIRENAEQILKILFPTSIWSLNRGISEYFGSEKWETLSQGSMVDWGWKDPRTSFTFPIWLRIFPNARFLHIVRNGIDVAISTHRRAHKQRTKLWKRIFPLDYSPLTLDFLYCFELWEKYVTFILEYKEIIHSSNYLEMRYEDLLASPIVHLQKITNFIGYPITGEALKSAAKRINQGRLDNTEYAKPYQEVIPALITNPWMRQLGYYDNFVTRGFEAGNES